MDRDGVAALIAQIADYPLPGVVFKDVTPISGDPEAALWVNQEIAQHFANSGVTRIVGVEARGFILGASLASHMHLGFVPIRKSGKLPRETYRAEYELEYGSDSIEIHRDALNSDDRVIIVDDVLATGGTACAAIDLIQECGAQVVGIAILLDLTFLGGSAKVANLDSGIDVFAVL
ncbi:MAG: adenine phosphoribosyltransferase [Actinobacteria bacterium]|uniref:adenine phosphoribosyltransferase n=1 Tax=freshwater metagenome TaxID=449393 RepID=A0A6J6T9Q9_9ZZZZ|nr:adenine phosphoribosyltransferase [Actinomycetota bacterium]